jgi:hypothetical protein
MFVPTSVWEQS